MIPVGQINKINIDYFRQMDDDQLLYRRQEAQNYWFNMLMSDNKEIVTLGFWEAVQRDIEFVLNERNISFK